MKLLVAVDSSECCHEAVKHLRMSGISMGARVRFVHVMREGQEAKDVSASLKDVTALLTNASSVETIYAEGNAADRIVELAAEWESDMIAMGTSDKRGLERIFLGSVSKSVLSRADCPVLILRGEPKNLDNVLVAADDSESSAACIEWLSNQVWPRHKNIAILSVMEEAPVAFNSEFSSVETASEEMLRKQQAELRASHLSQCWSELCAANLKKPQIPFVVTDGMPTEAILSLSKQWHTDLIVLGSNCKSGIEKVIHGSVSETVADKAPCSVLVVRDVMATQFEEIRIEVGVSAEKRRLETEKVLSARAYTSLSTNDFSGHFPANL